MPGKQQNIPYYAVFKAINIGRLVLDGIDNFGKVPLAQDTADKLCGVVSSLIVWIYGTVNILPLAQDTADKLLTNFAVLFLY